jgi:ankyrin repeat protein
MNKYVIAMAATLLEIQQDLNRLKIIYNKELEKLQKENVTMATYSTTTPLNTTQKISSLSDSPSTKSVYHDHTSTPTTTLLTREGYFVTFFQTLYNNEKYIIVHEMVKGNKFEELEKYVELNPESLQYTDERGQTPLHISADEDNIEMIRFLLNLGKKYPNLYVRLSLSFSHSPILSFSFARFVILLSLSC